MSNYITIESGNFLPFKENETDPELKIWADKYLEIFNKIHETLLPYETSDFFPDFSRYTDLCREEKECQVWDFYHSREREKIREEKREMLRQWTYRLPGDKSLSELKEELRECLLHRVWKGYKSLLINESNIINVELDGGCLVVGTGVLNTKIYGFEVLKHEMSGFIGFKLNFWMPFLILNVEVYIVAAVFKKPIKTFN